MHLMMYLQAAGQVASDAAAQAASGASDNPTATLGLAVVIPFLLQAMKNSTWFPWVSRQTSRINFVVGVIAASAATFGIHATWDASTGGSITLPSLMGLWQAFVQWTAQQTAYKGLVVPAETLGEIRTLLERVLSPPPVSEGAAKAGEGTGEHHA